MRVLAASPQARGLTKAFAVIYTRRFSKNQLCGCCGGCVDEFEDLDHIKSKMKAAGQTHTLEQLPEYEASLEDGEKVKANGNGTEKAEHVEETTNDDEAPCENSTS